jgi:hypothetical protein
MISSLSLPTDLAERLFASARSIRLAAGRALFAAGDPSEWVLIELRQRPRARPAQSDDPDPLAHCESTWGETSTVFDEEKPRRRVR